MGNILHAVAQIFPPKPKWSVDEIPDLSGKVVMVTGGNTGVGKETIKALLTHNAKVYLATRSASKAQEAISELKSATGGKEAIFLELDLADLKSVRKAAEEFLRKEERLDILFENAAVMRPPTDSLTAQSYDLQFGTNVIGHHHLHSLLLPAILRASDTAASPQDKPRIVITSSSASYMAKGLNWDTLGEAKLASDKHSEMKKRDKARKKMGPAGLYNQSKFANVVVARELARRYGDKIVVTSCNPGNLKTDLQRYMSSLEKRIINALILYPASYGALTQLWAGTMPECADHNGKFLIPWARVGTPHPGTQDPKTGEKLWEWLESAREGY